jgi:uncharacterized membrane protein
LAEFIEGLGPNGFWFGLIAGLAVGAIVFFFMWRRNRGLYNKAWYYEVRSMAIEEELIYVVNAYDIRNLKPKYDRPLE